MDFRPIASACGATNEEFRESAGSCGLENSGDFFVRIPGAAGSTAN
jgi:hypothetical protein